MPILCHYFTPEISQNVRFHKFPIYLRRYSGVTPKYLKHAKRYPGLTSSIFFPKGAKGLKVFTAFL